MTGSEPGQAGWHQPADFAPQAAVWLGWPTMQWYSDPALDTRRPLADILAALDAHGVAACVLCGSEAGGAAVRDWLATNDYPVGDRVRFIPVDPVDIWLRDFGPIFTLNSTNRLGIAGFTQNAWGYGELGDPESRAMTGLPGEIARHLGLNHLARTAVVSEGGNRIVNGRGTLLVGRCCERQRNPGLPEQEIEAEFRRLLGAQNIVWLNSGMHEDAHSDWGPIPYPDGSGGVLELYTPQTTGGHLDEFVRMAEDNRVVLAEVDRVEAASDPIAAVNHVRCQEACRILSCATDERNMPFRLLRLPTPDVACRAVAPGEAMYRWLAELPYPEDAPAFPHGQEIQVVRAASYANYLVTDGLVIAPRYGNPQKDAEAARVLEVAYPGRSVVQIGVDALNYAGGGIHCCTQEQPASSD